MEQNMDYFCVNPITLERTGKSDTNGLYQLEEEFMSRPFTNDSPRLLTEAIGTEDSDLLPEQNLSLTIQPQVRKRKQTIVVTREETKERKRLYEKDPDDPSNTEEEKRKILKAKKSKKYRDDCCKKLLIAEQHKGDLLIKLNSAEGEVRRLQLLLKQHGIKY